jgi:hypothetical protein
VVIYCDETTDRMGRCVFAVLFGTLEGNTVQQLFLGSCSFLPTANATICTQVIVDTLKDMNIEYDNVLSMCTDSAPYMIKCANTLSVIIGDHFLPFTCWAHKFNLLGEIWQDNLRELNSAVAKLKNIFRNARKLKTAYKTYLAAEHPELVTKLYPIPVLTRWSSWFNSVIYVVEYFDAMLGFFKSQDKLSAQGNLFLEMMTPAIITKVKIQATFVSENCHHITEPILELQSKEHPVAHIVMSRLETLRKKCTFIMNGQFGDVGIKLAGVSATQRAALETDLKACGHKTLTKINKMMQGSETQILTALSSLFDPSMALITATQLAKVTAYFANLPFFERFTGDVLLCYSAFHDLLRVQSEGGQVDLTTALLSLKVKGPVYTQFAILCLQSVWLPVSNADSERFFSKYTMIVTDRRTSLSEKNIETCAMLQFGDVD